MTTTTQNRQGATMHTMTLREACHLAHSGKSESLTRAASALVGCPVGGWPETQRARLQMLNELPHKSERAFTLDEFIAAMHESDHAERYALRPVPLPDGGMRSRS